MIVLGLAGHAGSGKDTVADYLVERYGFIKFSFSDALYREVATAFGLESEDLLRDRATKEQYTEVLALKNCTDEVFRQVAVQALDEEHKRRGIGLFIYPEGMGLSPRQILQWWGTEYRRAQDPDYWVNQAEDFIRQMTSFGPYAELRPQYFVNTSVRFPDEREWVHSFAPFGSVWHLHRDAAIPVASHESETPLPVLEGEREIWNNYTIEYLHMGINRLMNSNIPSIRIEPPEPMQSPESEITTRDGLLWRDGKIIDLPEADRVARAHGHDYAERFVKFLEGK